MTLVAAENSLPIQHHAVVFRAISDGAVLLHTGDEVYYGLNPVGARIWQLLPESASMAQLCASLQVHYPDVDPGELQADVEELLGALRNSGLVIERA